MLKKTYFIGAVAAGAGLLASGIPAMAGTVDNDGVNIGDDNNISLLPVQLCQTQVIAALVPVGSPHNGECVNAPVVDHPSTSDDSAPGRSGEGSDKPGKHRAEPKAPENPRDGMARAGSGRTGLPTAPTPTSISGHHAVTG